MRGGDLNQQVAVYSADELGKLAAAFNQMSADLHRAQELRQQMTADIAHELRTPLTVIAGYVEGLTDGTFKPTPTRLEAIQSEVALLRRLVEDLRTLSLADAGELKLMKQPVPPRDLLDSVAQSFGALASKQGVALNTQTSPDLPAIPLDRERMIQVLTNLTANALRYTLSGGAVTLRAEQAPQGVQFSVQDTGAGISPEHLPNIFERFYRADSARHTENGESGLGLAIAKSIVEAHRGTIHAESVVGGGTTMKITLPLAGDKR
jgi:signal transduction histidine kinase